MLKAGLVGAGHLGKIHLKLLQQSDQYELSGFHDADEQNGRKLEAEFGYRYFSDFDELLSKVDMVDIVTPTLYHYDYALKAIHARKHFFIEKPVTQTLEQAQEIMQYCREYGIKAQVGHVERYNPAFIGTRSYIQNPMFIEIHRLAEFNPRGTMRKSRFFQQDAYISVDFLDKKAEVIRMRPAPVEPSDFDMIIENAEGEKNQIIFQYPDIQPNNAILDELESFAKAIQQNEAVEVSLEDGTEALKVALEIMRLIEKR